MRLKALLLINYYYYYYLFIIYLFIIYLFISTSLTGAPGGPRKACELGSVWDMYAFNSYDKGKDVKVTKAAGLYAFTVDDRMGSTSPWPIEVGRAELDRFDPESCMESDG